MQKERIGKSRIEKDTLKMSKISRLFRVARFKKIKKAK